MRKYVYSVIMVLTISIAHAQEPESYRRLIMTKAGDGVINLLTAPLEIPKNIITTTNNNDNVMFGLFGGMVKGVVNTIGRSSVGFVDLITAPIPTKPIVYPIRVWDDFNTDTQYGEIFRTTTNK